MVSRPRLKGRPRHPFKVHVWAAISRRGVSKIAIFTRIMDATFFIEGVLRPHLLPFIESVYPDGHRFMQNIIYYIILLYNNYLIYYLIYYIQ